MTKIISGKKEDVDKKAVGIIKKSVDEILTKKKHVNLAIPGGRSVQGIFHELSLAENFSWSKIHIFMVDERLVPITSDDSNFKLASTLFLDKLVAEKKILKENIHPFILDETESDYGLSNYETLLKSYGGCYDIVILGVGEDGHVGALFPNHHSITDNSELFLTMGDSPKPPGERMTFSRKHLLKAKSAIALFYGEGKRDAYKKFFESGVFFEECPVRLIKEINDSYVFTDLG